MAIRIHHNPASQHARRVHMAVLELGLDVEMKLVDFMKGEHQSPAYLAVNPNGKVPTLEHDGLVLWESNAIMAYLADQKPGALYPTEAKARANVNRWLFWESAHFGPAAIALTWERVMKPAFMKQEGEPVLIAAGEANLKRFGAVLNGQLEGKQFVTGDALTIADLALASILTYRQHAKMDTAPYKHLEAWLGRIEARDSWQATKPPF
jgi:glutathione S-transferase